MFSVSILNIKLLTLSWIIAKRQLIHDRTASRNSWDDIYDFIIVGAGTAGCTIAKRLTENPNERVLLLEAGGPQLATYTDLPGLVFNITDNKPHIQYMYYSEPQKNVGKQIPGGRLFERLGKLLGGSSSHNTLVYNRGNRRDYDKWESKYGANGWSYEEVLPFFIKFENNTDIHIVRQNPKYHGVSGPVQISTPKNPPNLLKLLQKIYIGKGFKMTDFNGPRQIGNMFMQLFVDNKGFRTSAANAYIDPNPNPNNLHIVTKAQVTRILFKGLTAVGVEFIQNDNPFTVYVTKEVILTAGAINTPKLLMLSGIGISSHLQQMGIPLVLELPVGNNYQNHPGVLISTRIKNPVYFNEPPLLNIKQLSKIFFQNKGRLSENHNLLLYFDTKTKNKTNYPNALLQTMIRNSEFYMFVEIVRIRSRGTIRLISDSPYIQPRIDPQFLSNPQDFEDAVDGTVFAFYILESSSIAPYVSPPTFESIGCPVCNKKYRYECIDSIRCYVRYNTLTTSHPSGTCRMGDIEREDVVVDPQLRVKNVKQLRVCDASIFPLSPNSNINAPTNMVGEKCAHIIKQNYNI